LNLKEQIETRAYQIWREAIHEYIQNPEFRDFYLWAISPQNPHQQEFTECLGFHQIINLFDVATDGLFTGEAAERVIEALSLMTVQQVFEVNSDSLAIGLARSRAHWSQEMYQREWLLRIFNQTMRTRIQSETNTALQLLKPYQSLFQTISLFEQSLTARKQRRSAKAYLDHIDRTDIHLSQLEYATYGPLVAHIELTATMVDEIRGLHIFDLFVDGLHRRYTSVDDTLLHFPHPVKERVATGRDTILIIPTIAFFIGTAYEQATDKRDVIKNAIDVNLMQPLLARVATLIRLLNDLGTPLLDSDEQQVEQFIEEVNWSFEQADVPFIQFLHDVAPENPYLARIEKDLVFGEANVLLDGIRFNRSGRPDIEQFAQDIFDCRAIYVQELAEYAELRTEAQKTLSSVQFLEPVDRVLTFHQKLYSGTFWTQIGEYNI
jgi:hypothetical protein